MRRWALCVLLLGCDDDVGDAAPAKDPMDMACDRIAAELCEALRGCCAAAGADVSTCEAEARARCEPLAEEVRQGRARYDEGAARACASEERAVFGDCTLTVLSYTLASSAELLSCQRIFTTGTAAPGDPCARDTTCAPGPRADTLAYCDTDVGRCALLEILAEGKSCTDEEGGDTAGICGQDLFCRHQPGTTSGTCVAKTAAGGPCAGDALAPCASDTFCDAVAQRCSPRKEGGEPCASAVECRSLDCAGGLCGAASSFFDARVCGGQER